VNATATNSCGFFQAHYSHSFYHENPAIGPIYSECPVASAFCFRNTRSSDAYSPLLFQPPFYHYKFGYISTFANARFLSNN